MRPHMKRPHKRPLGKNQEEVLRLLRTRYGVWKAGGGWSWGTNSDTDRVLLSLKRRGLVVRLYVDAYGYGVYVPVEAVQGLAGMSPQALRDAHEAVRMAREEVL